MNDEPRIAVFVDFENLALGVRQSKKGDRFEIERVLKRLLEKGRIVFKRAYCDWTKYREDKRTFHTNGIELVDIPHTKVSGKNSADIHMVVDALDLCYAKQHIDIFALLTGDSDFSPLASKLKENDKRVIGCGVRNSTSDLLLSNCDEFIFYDDLVQAAPKPRTSKARASKASSKEAIFDQLTEIVRSLHSDYDPLWGSIVKQTMRRVAPDFNETKYGFKLFSELLEAAEDRGDLKLEYDEGRGNYKIRLARTTRA
ncbi:MAG: NYN domain-containing protein [Myxococcota bacterium]|nr:NYN domain-containing protein [Myxococcota bacterium]